MVSALGSQVQPSIDAHSRQRLSRAHTPYAAPQMTDSQKLAMQAMALMKANNLPDEVSGTVLDLLMQAGFVYCMEQLGASKTLLECRNEEIIKRATQGIH